MYEGSQDNPLEIPAGSLESAAGGAGSKRPSPLANRKLDAAQRAKRVRVSRACDQCRAGREKCDGGQPHCQTCESQGRPCSYHEQPKKRGIQPNYIRTLELTLAWVFESYPESEARLSRLLPRADEPAHQLIAWKDAVASETLHAGWRNGIISKQIDQLLSGVEIDLPKTPSPAPEVQVDLGPRTDMPYQSPPLSAPSDRGGLHQESHESMAGASDLTQPQIVAVSKDLGGDLLRLPDNSWALLEHYFAFTQTWLPIIERHDILKLMYTYPEQGLWKRDAVGSGHAELWSIMAFASLQMNGTSSNHEFELCRDVAKSLIPSEQGFQLGHIKALLILGLSELLRKAWVTAWLVIGSAVRLLTHFNLGKGTNTTLFEGRTKHTILAAFLLESSVASQTAAICHIRPEDIKDVGLLIEDGLEEWSPWQDPAIGPISAATKSPARSISTFNSLVRDAMCRQTGTHMTSPSSHRQSTSMDAVNALLHNASSKTTRQHPGTVLANVKVSQVSNVEMDNSPAGVAHLQSGTTHFGFTNPFMDHDYAYMSIPNEGAESLVSSTPANQMNTSGTSTMWGGGGSAALQETPGAHGSVSTEALAGGDIFEELAMLDRSNSAQNPKFMQNLGFGPDLDLAEFFGPDYQFTDPSAFSELSQSFDTSSKEPG